MTTLDEIRTHLISRWVHRGHVHKDAVEFRTPCTDTDPTRTNLTRINSRDCGETIERGHKF